MIRMKKSLKLIILLSFLFSGMLSAKPIDPKDALRVAQNFWNSISEKSPNSASLHQIDCPSFSELYLFANGTGDGFVIVSGDDCAIPVLAYSTNSTIDVENMPENAEAWLHEYDREIRYMKEHDIAAAPSVQEKWDQLLSDKAPQVIAVVSPLLSTTWSQGMLYNDLCPYDNQYHTHAFTGCTATAMAQVMKYWNYPASGVASHSYLPILHPEYGRLSADFANTTYDWANMPNQLSDSSTAVQNHAVATLMYHVGVSVNMEYGPWESGARVFDYQPELSTFYSGVPCAERALKYYFRYKPTLHGEVRADYSDAQWNAMLCNELDKGRPMLYSGYNELSGHALVCDGYDNNNMFHFNFGWGGDCDGYYAIGALNPAENQHYNFFNDVLLGIEPDSSFRVDPGSFSFPQAGGSANVYVGSSFYESGDWTALADQPWVTLSSSSGSGNGVITRLSIAVDTNVTGATRTATVSVTHGGQTIFLPVVQSGCPDSNMCNITLVVNGNRIYTTGVSVESLDGVDYGTYLVDSLITQSFTVSVSPEPLRFVWQSKRVGSQYGYSVRNAVGEVLLTQDNPCYSCYDTVETPCIDCAISEIPYIMGFEAKDHLFCWSFVDADADGYGWTNEVNSHQGANFAHTGSCIVTAVSSVEGVRVENPDDWLISPPVKVPDDGLKLVWYEASLDTASLNEHYGVFVSTTGSDLDDFSSMVFEGFVEDTAYRYRSVLLDNYAGRTIYVAFRHWNGPDNAKHSNNLGNTLAGLFVPKRPPVSSMKIDDVSFVYPSDSLYVITADVNNGSWGSVMGDGVYVGGTVVSLSAISKSGYHFDCWQDGNTDNPRSVTVSGNATYVANFVQDPPSYSVYAWAANPDMGWVEGGGTYVSGTVITLTAIPFEGYHFKHWSNGNSNNPIVFEVTQNETYVAVFGDDISVDEVESEDVRLYPNPTSGVLNIEAEGLQKVELYDAVGRMVLMSQTSNSTSINLSALAPGIYTIRLTLPQGTIIRKVVRK